MFKTAAPLKIIPTTAKINMPSEFTSSGLINLGIAEVTIQILPINKTVEVIKADSVENKNNSKIEKNLHKEESFLFDSISDDEMDNLFSFEGAR